MNTRMVLLCMILGWNIFHSDAQEGKTALVLIDIQDFYFDETKMPLTGNLEAAEKAALLLDYFRKSNQLVIHIKHKGGGEIHPLVNPLPGEKVIEKTEVNSFKNTDLDSFLKENHITRLVLAGMQTQMCLEGAARAGSDLGYTCTVIHDACAARDLEFQGHIVKAADVHYSTLNTLKAYSKIMSASEFIENPGADK